MESDRFDALARTLARPASRRSLAALAAAAFAPVAAAAKPAPAKCLPIGKRCSLSAASGAARAKGKRRPAACSKCCSRLGTAGPDGKARCSCKGEGIECDNPSQCCSGDCRNGSCTACPPNTVFCADGCADLQTNRQHCGSCDTPCDSGQRCVAGSCVCDGQSCPTGCCGGANGTTCQRGTSDQACGTGGAKCQTCGQCATCDGSTCAPANIGQSCTAPYGGTDDAVCQADGRCCVPSGGKCGFDCSPLNCCGIGGCLCVPGTCV